MRPIAYMTGWAVAFWFAVAVAALGQEIGGLSSVPPLTEARFPVRGLSVPEGSLDDLSKWASKLVVSVDSPDESTPSIEVDIGLARRQPVLYFSADKPGLYVLLVVDVTAAKPVIVSKRVQVGEPQPNPPQPGPGPVVPVPVTSGPRLMILVRETSQITPQMARTEIDLRDGAAAKYLAEKKHRLIIQSDDQPLPTSLGTVALEAFERAKGKTLPALVVIDPAAKDFSGVLAVDSIPSDAKPSDILDVIKRNGG